MQNNNYKLNFLGGGNIAKALITGLINSGFLSDDIKVYDIDSEKLNNLSKLTGVKGSTELSDIKDGFVILCVKPKDYPDLVLEIKNKILEKSGYREVFDNNNTIDGSDAADYNQIKDAVHSKLRNN